MDHQVVLYSLHVLNIPVSNWHFNIPFLLISLYLNCSNFMILIIVLCLDFQPRIT